MDQEYRELERQYQTTGETKFLAGMIQNLRRSDKLSNLITDHDSEIRVLSLIPEYSEEFREHRRQELIRDLPATARSRMPLRQRMLQNKNFTCWRILLSVALTDLTHLLSIPGAAHIKRKGYPTFDCLVWTTDEALGREAVRWILEKLDASSGFIEAIPVKIAANKAAQLYSLGLHEDAITTIETPRTYQEEQRPPNRGYGGYGYSPGDPRREWYRDRRNPSFSISGEKFYCRCIGCTNEVARNNGLCFFCQEADCMSYGNCQAKDFQGLRRSRRRNPHRIFGRYLRNPCPIKGRRLKKHRRNTNFRRRRNPDNTLRDAERAFNAAPTDINLYRFYREAARNGRRLMFRWTGEDLGQLPPQPIVILKLSEELGGHFLQSYPNEVWFKTFSTASDLWFNMNRLREQGHADFVIELD